MTVLQHYYTSFRDPETGSGGFKTKAVSPGISPTTQTLINQLILYRIPTGLDVNAIESHPVALRYYYVNPGESVLLASRSCGTDENGRPGNFFAHTVVLPPDQFTSVPPIFYWNSDFWKRSDASPQSQIAPLANFDAEPMLSDDDVWRFLAQGNRREALRKLLAAVIYSARTSRRIIIYDQPNIVALWIAAISCALPPLYRPLLTFATYHPDPYQSPYLITGTTAGTDFHNYPEEYLRYFVLNGETGEISKVDDSPYAAEIAPAMQRDSWEAKVLPLFEMCTRRFPALPQIDEQLDLLIAYHSVITSGRSSSLSPTQLDGLRIALSGFEENRDFDSDDVSDLNVLTTALGAELRRQHTDDGLRAYARALTLSQAHDPGSARARLPADLRVATERLSGGDISSARALFAVLSRVFGERSLAAALNDPAYLSDLGRMASGATARNLVALWEYLVPAIQPTPACQGLVAASLRWMTPGADGRLSDDASALLAEIVRRISANDREWLALAVAATTASPNLTAGLETLYYTIVRELPLDARVRYRATVQPAYPDITMREVQLDVRRGGASGAVGTLERWAMHAANANGPLRAQPWLSTGLEAAQSVTSSPTAWRQVAVAALISPTLSQQLPAEWQQRLLKTAFNGLSLAGLQPMDVTLCRTYAGATGFPQETAILILGVLAMASGELDQAKAQQLRQRFSKLRAEEYQPELAAFMAKFFEDRVTRESHGLMVVSAYIWESRDLFWTCYWAEFSQMLLDPKRAPHLVDVLSFWFDSSLSALGDLPYVVQSFFLRLPGTVDEARKERGFRDTAREVSGLAARKPWFPVVQDLFSTERKGILGMFGR